MLSENLHPEVSSLTPLTPDKELYGQLDKFICEVSRKLPKVKFGYNTYGFKSHVGSRLSKVFLYYPGDIHAMGKIAFEDPTSSGPYKDRFCVYAQGITNNKYNHGENTHLAATDNITRAVRNVARLRRIKPEQSLYTIARKAIRVMVATANDKRQTYHQACRDAWGISDNNSPVAKELVHAYKIGYNFIQPDMREKIAETIRTLEEYNNMANIKNNWYCVKLTHTDEDGDIVIYIKMDVQGEPKDWERSFNLIGDAEIRSPKIVPYALQERLAALQMLQDKEYVEGVGVRLTDENFFVLTDSPVVEVELDANGEPIAPTDV